MAAADLAGTFRSRFSQLVDATASPRPPESYASLEPYMEPSCRSCAGQEEGSGVAGLAAALALGLLAAYGAWRLWRAHRVHPGHWRGTRCITQPSEAAPPEGFVLYHAAWCGHCKRLRPAYRRLAAARPGAAFYECDDEVLRKGGGPQSLGIAGYPTVAFFRGGRLVDRFAGDRGDEALRSFVDQYA